MSRWDEEGLPPLPTVDPEADAYSQKELEAVRGIVIAYNDAPSPARRLLVTLDQTLATLAERDQQLIKERCRHDRNLERLAIIQEALAIIDAAPLPAAPVTLDRLRSLLGGALQ